MKTTLLPIATATSETATQTCELPELPENLESFASVLDRFTAGCTTMLEGGEPGAAVGETGMVEASEDAPVGEVSEAAEELTALPPPALAVALPLLPHRPGELMSGPWCPAGEVEPSEGSDDVEPRAHGEARVAAIETPAQTAATISAGPQRERNIFAATTGATDVEQTMPAREVRIPGATEVRDESEKSAAATSYHRRPAGEEGPRVGDVPVPQPLSRLGGEVSAGTGELPMVPRLSLPARGMLIPPDEALTGPYQRRPAGGESPRVGDMHAPGLRSLPASEMLARTGEPPVVRHGSLPAGEMLAETSEPLAPVASAPEISQPRQMPGPRDGIPAAEGGEAMPTATLQAPPKPRVATSAEASATPAGPLEIAPTPGIEHAVEETGVRSIATAAQVVAMTHRAPEARRVAAGQTHLPAISTVHVAMNIESRGEVRPSRSQGVVAAAPVEAALTHEEERPALSDPTRPAESGTPANFPAIKLPAESVATAPVTDDAPIHHVEVVRIAERTIEAAVRLRATGPERIEVNVQLESGDRLTIRLQLANGEVTPTFHSTSEGLRTALEQNWSQFSDRASDRGVRLTSPVFDVNSSSSNMSDLGQQRHGRDAAYADAQAELFPHLPRRMRAPRVLAAAPTSPTPAIGSGVRAYA